MACCGAWWSFSLYCWGAAARPNVLISAAYVNGQSKGLSVHRFKRPLMKESKKVGFLVAFFLDFWGFLFLIELWIVRVSQWLCTVGCCDTDLKRLAVFHTHGLISLFWRFKCFCCQKSVSFWGMTLAPPILCLSLSLPSSLFLLCVHSRTTHGFSSLACVQSVSE